MKVSNLTLTLQALNGSNLETATCIRVFKRSEWDEKKGKYSDSVIGYTYHCKSNCIQEGKEDFFDVKVDGIDEIKTKNAEEIIEAIKNHGQAEVRFKDFSAKAYAFLGKDKTLVAGVSAMATEAVYEVEILL